MPNLPTRYKDKIREQEYQIDPVQEQVVDVLQHLLKEITAPKSFWPFSKKQSPQGVYIYGGVGRGKSMIMDLFYYELPAFIKKRRVHFHEFMIETHDWLHQNRAERVDDLLPQYAAYVADNIRVLCFDEFHVTDIADAMILGRLFTSLFEKGVIVVSTSNRHPDALYKGGLQRELFLPFIALLKQQMQVMPLDGDTDYRQISDADQGLYYFHPLTKETEKKINHLFFEITDFKAPKKDILTVKGREMEVMSSGGIARFCFKDLCERPLGAEDYIEIANTYHTVFIESVIFLSAEKRNEAKRFILLIDCLYEAGCRVILSAARDIHELYEGDDHAFEFERTMSRLMEMQSIEYHRNHQERLA